MPMALKIKHRVRHRRDLLERRYVAVDSDACSVCATIGRWHCNRSFLRAFKADRDIDLVTQHGHRLAHAEIRALDHDLRSGKAGPLSYPAGTAAVLPPFKCKRDGLGFAVHASGRPSPRSPPRSA